MTNIDSSVVCKDVIKFYTNAEMTNIDNSIVRKGVIKFNMVPSITHFTKNLSVRWG